MKKNFYIFSILFLFSGVILAQNGQKTIIEDLNTPKAGQGNVRVMQDETIQNIVGVFRSSSDTVGIRNGFDQPVFNSKARGYRIQVFSGNNQQKSRKEGEAKQAQIRNAFPGLETYLTFDAPFWRLRVGNFQTREEAEETLRELKRTFPSYGREMYVVSSSR